MLAEITAGDEAELSAITYTIQEGFLPFLS